MTISLAELAPLPNPDGSATYTRGSHGVLTAVNGPLEVPRKNEIPEEAYLEINIRPATGHSGPRERHLEAILASVLRKVVLVKEHPRQMVQVTCQVLSTPGSGDGGEGSPSSHLPLLPALLQSSILALLAACIPLSQTLVSTCVAVMPADATNTNTLNTDGANTTIKMNTSAVNADRSRVVDPTPSQVATAKSLHVLAFSSLKSRALLLAESEGSFDMDEYEDVYADTLARCCADETSVERMEVENGSESEDEGVGLGDAGNKVPDKIPARHANGEDVSEQRFLQRTVAGHVRGQRKWKADIAG